jgi:PIN domain nuclease of toxin-antitoxin system
LKILIDSHAFIWSVAEPERLSARALRVLTHPDYELMFSMASLWELTIKIASGKLTLAGSSVRDIVATLRKNGVGILPIRIEHILRLETLPLHHRDPFDRLLIVQAMEDDLTILTNDAQFRHYPAKLIW